MTVTGNLTLAAKKSNKLLNLTAYRGAVVAVGKEPSKNSRSLIDVIATVVLDSGLQKSIAITNSLNVIPGNEIAFILDGSEQVIFLKNFASNETETASLEDDRDGHAFGFVVLGIAGGFMMKYGGKAPILFLGMAFIVIGVFAAVKIVISNLRRDAQIDEIFQSTLTSMGIPLESCKSTLTQNK